MGDIKKAGTFHNVPTQKTLTMKNLSVCVAKIANNNLLYQMYITNRTLCEYNLHFYEYIQNNKPSFI